MNYKLSIIIMLLLPLLINLMPISAQDITRCEVGFRLIEHAMGMTCVSDNPQRIVVLDTGELDGVLSLGIKPIGAIEAMAGAGFSSYLAGGITDGIEVVGTIAEPNLEAILSLSPDLILSSKLRHEDLYDELSAIAPTVFTERVGVAWKENLVIYADALNRQDALAIRLAEYESRLETIRQVIDVENIEVSIIRFVPGQNRVMQRGSFIGTIIDDIGLARPESQRGDDFMVTISLEQINLMDGDVIFMSYYGTADETEQASFTESPLWQTLTATQNNTVYAVDDAHWFLSIGFLGANRVLDDILITLTNNE